MTAGDMMAFVKLRDHWPAVFAARADFAGIDFDLTVSALAAAGMAPCGCEWTTLLDFYNIFTGMGYEKYDDDKKFVIDAMGIDFGDLTDMVIYLEVLKMNIFFIFRPTTSLKIIIWSNLPK